MNIIYPIGISTKNTVASFTHIVSHDVVRVENLILSAVLYNTVCSGYALNVEVRWGDCTVLFIVHCSLSPVQ